VNSAPRLRLLAGGRRTRWRHGGLELVSAPPEEAPFPVERYVVEEDRWRVLGASPEWRPSPPEHPIRLHTELVFDTPAALGSIASHGRRWHAVVVDLEAEPLVAADVVAMALTEIAARCRHHAVARLALPLLGTVHGDLDPQRALGILYETLLTSPPPGLRRLWLLTPLRHQVVIEQALARWVEESD
jgi:hypothetical protein